MVSSNDCGTRSGARRESPRNIQSRSNILVMYFKRLVCFASCYGIAVDHQSSAIPLQFIDTCIVNEFDGQNDCLKPSHIFGFKKTQ